MQKLLIFYFDSFILFVNHRFRLYGRSLCLVFKKHPIPISDSFLMRFVIFGSGFGYLMGLGLCFIEVWNILRVNITRIKGVKKKVELQFFLWSDDFSCCKSYLNEKNQD